MLYTSDSGMLCKSARCFSILWGKKRKASKNTFYMAIMQNLSQIGVLRIGVHRNGMFSCLCAEDFGWNKTSHSTCKKCPFVHLFSRLIHCLNLSAPSSMSYIQRKAKPCIHKTSVVNIMLDIQNLKSFDKSWQPWPPFYSPCSSKYVMVFLACNVCN